MIEEKLAQFVKEIKGYDSGVEISLKGKTFFEDFKFDSIDIMQLLIKIEEEFGSVDSNEEIISVINDCDLLIDYISKKNGKKRYGN